MKTTNLICDIIQTELGLKPGQVMVYNQRFKIPATFDVFITVGVLGMKPYSNINKAASNVSGLSSEQSLAVQETISINVMSANTSSIDAFPLVMMAMGSTYAQQVQDKYQFSIGVIPASVADTSFLEESTQMTRQTITLQVLRSYSKIKQISYYDNFEKEILTEQGEVQ